MHKAALPEPFRAAERHLFRSEGERIAEILRRVKGAADLTPQRLTNRTARPPVMPQPIRYDKPAPTSVAPNADFAVDDRSAPRRTDVQDPTGMI